MTDLDITSAFTTGSEASGQWRLFVRDPAKRRTGRIHSFSVEILSTE